MIQIAASTLEIPIENIHTAEMSTDKIPNTSATAASMSNDIYGMAVHKACLELNERLKSYREKNPKGTLKDWARAAHFDRISLSATGFYAPAFLTYDQETNSGQRFSYFTMGVAVSIVELDVLTGDHTILQTDIVMDIGRSINYSVDIGQIEGAFIQGVGWCTLEELLITPSSGALITRGPGNYKIPSAHNIPQKFNVRIVCDKVYKDLETIKSSKGVGEPPLFMSASVFFALRNAVVNARFFFNFDHIL
jgi:xanthine dehydrogenase/oxidase